MDNGRAPQHIEHQEVISPAERTTPPIPSIRIRRPKPNSHPIPNRGAGSVGPLEPTHAAIPKGRVGPADQFTSPLAPSIHVTQLIRSRGDTNRGAPAGDLSDDGAQAESATLGNVSPAVAKIVQLWRLRVRWLKARNTLILQGRAICRSWTEGDKDKANVLFDHAASGEAVDATLQMALTPFLEAIEHFDPMLKSVEKTLRKSARSTALWPWVADVRGFGDLNLAGIVGECGEIASYRNPSCLWMRMGLGVVDGGRQRKVLDPELAIVHGYNPSRRAVAFNLGECLIKAGSRYKAVYDERKAAEMTRDGATKIHAHRRAARYMVKRVLRDLWIEAKRVA
jgi:hypothetical protein